MINYNGYYLNLVKKEFDSRINDDLIVVNAFVFYKNNTYKVLSKMEYSNHIVDFYTNHLLDESIINGAFSQNINTTILKPNEKYGNSFVLKKIDENTLYNSITNSNMIFVSWEEHMRLKGDKKSKNILKKIFKI